MVFIEVMEITPKPEKIQVAQKICRDVAEAEH